MKHTEYMEIPYDNLQNRNVKKKNKPEKIINIRRLQ